jgi:hypothetical protein
MINAHLMFVVHKQYDYVYDATVPSSIVERDNKKYEKVVYKCDDRSAQVLFEIDDNIGSIVRLESFDLGFLFLPVLYALKQKPSTISLTLINDTLSPNYQMDFSYA